MNREEVQLTSRKQGGPENKADGSLASGGPQRLATQTFPPSC